MPTLQTLINDEDHIKRQRKSNYLGTKLLTFEKSDFCYFYISFTYIKANYGYHICNVYTTIT
ncbi:hypothetical protein DYU05_06865 [Mucilaginibacter terrenus]|uniref:Uncharacterized protein n=1 Tax=Mucilaginibacter terrenus TaxID=2482727 RepID=A0A3E2NWL2_9SPHI|nr:hypothetical protein DYU05_06865 [Mucilaginibacter terrenus]